VRVVLFWEKSVGPIIVLARQTNRSRDRRMLLATNECNSRQTNVTRDKTNPLASFLLVGGSPPVNLLSVGVPTMSPL